jgi:hypothetical protein
MEAETCIQVIECPQVFSEIEGIFIRKHFTTQHVSAVALGLLKEGLAWERIPRIQRLPVFAILLIINNL